MDRNIATPIDATSSSIKIPVTQEINHITRAGHAEVIKLLTARLPQTIPPQSFDPGAYATGLLHMAPIYATFESLWENLLGIEPNDYGNAAAESSIMVDERLRSVLEPLYLPNLMRTSHIKADVCDMTGWSSNIYNKQSQAVGERGELAQFVTHMRQVILEKPHVLIAYSYLFFIGLFGGGRVIRASLESAGHEFWSAVPGPIRPTMEPCEKRTIRAVDRIRGENATQGLPLRFLSLDTTTDGKVLKNEYEETLLQVQDNLTPQERQDIIEESHAIFDRMIMLINQLDDLLHIPPNNHATSSYIKSILPTALLGRHKHTRAYRPRDSVVVAKERQKARDSSSQQNLNTTRSKSNSDVDADEDGEEENPRAVKFSKSLPLPPRGGGDVAGGGNLRAKSQGLCRGAAAGEAVLAAWYGHRVKAGISLTNIWMGSGVCWVGWVLYAAYFSVSDSKQSSSSLKSI